MKVRKAVFPAAGLGTRFLPATKAQPKEMLPLVDKPMIRYVVEEAVASGLSEIIIVTGRGKRAIEDHFDSAFELEYYLNDRGKTDELGPDQDHLGARLGVVCPPARAARARPRHPLRARTGRRRAVRRLPGRQHHRGGRDALHASTARRERSIPGARDRGRARTQPADPSIRRDQGSAGREPRAPG